MNPGIKAAALVLLALPLLCACEKRPDGVLSQSDMADLTADLELAEAYVEQAGGEFSSDSARKVLRQSVFLEHGVTEKEYAATVDWYGHHIDQYTKMYDKVLEKLRKDAGKTVDKEDEMSVRNLWRGSRMFTFMPNDFAPGISFELEGEDISLGDKLSWGMRISGSGQRLTAFLGADYPDGQTRYVTRSAMQPGKLKLTLQTDSLKIPTRIYGYLHIDDAPAATIWVDSIALIPEPLDSRSYSIINTHSRFSKSGKTAKVK